MWVGCRDVAARLTRSRAHEAERNVIELETPLKVLNARLLTEVHHLLVKLRDAESCIVGTHCEGGERIW